MLKKRSLFLIIAIMAVFLFSFSFASSAETGDEYVLTYPDGSQKTTDNYDEAQELLDKWELLASGLESDENGNVILEDWMKDGSILIEETKVPEGYKDETVIVETSIDTDGVEIVNEKVKGAYEDDGDKSKAAATGDSNNPLIYILAAVLSTAFLVILVMRRRKEAGKILSVLLVLGLTASIFYTIPISASAKTNTVDSFEIDKIDQYKEPVQGAVFSIYGKPVLETIKTNKVPLTISKSFSFWLDYDIEKVTLSVVDEDGNAVSSWDFDSSIVPPWGEEKRYHSKTMYLEPGKYYFKEELTPKTATFATWAEAAGSAIYEFDFVHYWQEFEILVKEDGTVEITLGEAWEDLYEGIIKTISDDEHEVYFKKTSSKYGGESTMVEETSDDDGKCVMLLDNSLARMGK